MIITQKGNHYSEDIVVELEEFLIDEVCPKCKKIPSIICCYTYKPIIKFNWQKFQNSQNILRKHICPFDILQLYFGRSDIQQFPYTKCCKEEFNNSDHLPRIKKKIYQCLK